MREKMFLHPKQFMKITIGTVAAPVLYWNAMVMYSLKPKHTLRALMKGEYYDGTRS